MQLFCQTAVFIMSFVAQVSFATVWPSVMRRKPNCFCITSNEFDRLMIDYRPLSLQHLSTATTALQTSDFRVGDR